MNKPFFAYTCPRQIKNAFISITGMNAFLPHRFRQASVCYIEVGVLVGSQLVSHFLAVGLLKVLHHLGVDLLALGAEDRSYHFAVCLVGMSAVIVEALEVFGLLGMLLAYLFLRTERITKDELWKNQARMMMNACLQLIADESNSFLGRNEKFIGWQPEQINHTYWDYFSEEKMMNGSFGIDIAWVNVLGYSSLLSIEREFPEIMKELYKNM